MIIIYRYGKTDASIAILKHIPKELLFKMNLSGEKFEVVTISGDNVDNITQAVDKLGGRYEYLGYGFGIVTISIDKIEDLVKLEVFQYIELPKTLYTTDNKSNSSACITRAQSTFGVSGEGVIVAFIDSGIDFTHRAFRKDDGTTRIEYIYDLSTTDKFYNRDKIDEALKSSDPYSVVPVVDVTEHGTHVAGIACAGGSIDKRYYGVAPKSSIIMVKSTRGQFAISTQIMRGLKFIVDKSKELKKPVVVNISLSTNNGAHNGKSLLEQYISTVATLERITIVIAAGNEGEASHHVGGFLEKENPIKFNVASDEIVVIMNIYKSVLPNISMEIINPMGLSSGIIEVKEGLKEDNIGSDKYEIYYTGAKPFDINGEIGMTIVPLGRYITEGQWTMILRPLSDYRGSYDIWMPVSEGLNIKTKFLEPTVLNTLGIPATLDTVISVGSYNAVLNNVSSFSGRGQLTIHSEAKPDLVAPGENITAPIPNNSFDSKTGTSMATPHVTGSAALLTEWGMVKGNDMLLYGNRLKYYLIVGARRTRKDVIYPDPSWGYGELCLFESFSRLIIDIGAAARADNKYEEYSTRGVFVRIPKEV